VEPSKVINFVMDNCGGQNKNRIVLRLLSFLIKWKITKVAKAIFLVKGHTKNDCDRLFNTMKKDYRKSNSFTPGDVLNCIKTASNSKVEPIMVAPDLFKDWETFENIYIKPAVQKVKANQIFIVDVHRNNGNSMWVYLQALDARRKSRSLSSLSTATMMRRFGRDYNLLLLMPLDYRTSNGESYTASGESMCQWRRRRSGSTTTFSL
jgi:hypothetical protein